MGKSTQIFHLRIDEHVPKIFGNWTKDFSDKPQKITFLLLTNNQECARNFKKDLFSILTRAENHFELHILVVLYTQTLKPNLCKQKNYVYQT